MKPMFTLREVGTQIQLSHIVSFSSINFPTSFKSHLPCTVALVMMRREGKDIDMFKNRKFIDYVRGFHDENYENYFIGLDIGYQLTGRDFRYISASDYKLCIKMVPLNGSAEKLIMFHVNDATFWPNCVSLSLRGGKVMVYKRSVCMCVDPETKLVVTCSCNDQLMPKISFQMWKEYCMEKFDFTVPKNRDIRYIGFSGGASDGKELKGGPEPLESTPFFKYWPTIWDVCVWSNETVTTPRFRQHCTLYSIIESKAKDYEINSYGRGGGIANMRVPFGFPFVASDKPRGTNINGGYWTPTPVPSGGGYSADYTCLLCSEP